ncbi:hypothetical protein L7F22_054790 [Adiantum nelumboides]|nr:hypothetical protein [Adiantum nelumboides]
MDPAKIEAIRNWPDLKNVHEVRSFLGLCSYYRRYVRKFAEIASPLHMLTQKGVPFSWGVSEVTAFQTLKDKMTTGPVLILSDLQKSFEVYCDACGRSLGAVLMQEGRAIAYESQAAFGEADAVGEHLVTVSRLSMQGQKNVVADALSRKPLVQAISAIHHSTFEDMIDQYATDPDFADIFTRIRDGETVAGYSLQEGYLMRKTMLCVTQPLREKVMTECHCPPYTGHRGIAITMKGVERYFYWPRLKKDVEEFVRSCLVCQKVKFDRHKAQGLLQPLSIRTRPWESIAMDFIFALPRTQSGHDGIWTIIDRFSKQTHFVPVKKTVKPDHLARLFVAQNKILEASEYTRDLDTAFAKVRETLQKSQERQKKAADRHRRDLKLKENDWVLLRFEKARLRKKKGKEKLSMRYYGSFQITEQINDISFRLRLPDIWKIHNVFHVNLWKTFGDVLDDGEPGEQPEAEENEEILVPEQVLVLKVTKKGTERRNVCSILVRMISNRHDCNRGVIEDDYNIFKRGIVLAHQLSIVRFLLGRIIDVAVAKNQKLLIAQELPQLLKKICEQKDNEMFQPAIMVLLLSVKNAICFNWFSNTEGQELLRLSKELGDFFTGVGGWSQVDKSRAFEFISKLLPRFYPLMTLQTVVVALEAKPGYEAMVCDFCVLKRPIPSEELRMFVIRTDNQETSSCLVTPNHVKLYHPQTKRILVSRDVVFVEDFGQPLLSCTRDSNVSSQDIYETLLPLFSGGSMNVNSNEANVQPMGVSENVTDQPITDVDVHDVLDEERAENEQARGMPKWLVHTLRDRKLDTPLSSRTRSCSCHASYASDCYALAVSSLHDVEESLSFDEAQNLENWMAAMKLEYDALIENDTWTLCDLPPGKKAIGTKWVYKLKRMPDGEIDRYKARLLAKGYA